MSQPRSAQSEMHTSRYQRTLAGPTQIAGVGYWTGKAVSVEFRPAAADSGIVFVRRDLPGCPRIPAHPQYLVEIPRRTSLRCGQASVEMIEHIMAALAGLQIDNCEVWVDEAEMPGCDGSALPFVEALSAAGIVAQDARRPTRFIRRPIRLSDGQSWIEARPSLLGKTILRYELDYGSGNPIGRQSLEVSLSPKYFQVNLAPSRTFMLETEAAALRAQGLGLHVRPSDLLVFDESGPIDNQLRFPDECVRHKLVDLIGDLALAGCDVVGCFAAYRSGHRLNAALVRAILAETDQQHQQHLTVRKCA